MVLFALKCSCNISSQAQSIVAYNLSGWGKLDQFGATRSSMRKQGFEQNILIGFSFQIFLPTGSVVTYIENDGEATRVEDQHLVHYYDHVSVRLPLQGSNASSVAPRLGCKVGRRWDSR